MTETLTELPGMSPRTFLDFPFADDLDNAPVCIMSAGNVNPSTVFLS